MGCLYSGVKVGKSYHICPYVTILLFKFAQTSLYSAVAVGSEMSEDGPLSPLPTRNAVHTRVLVIYTGGTIGMCELAGGEGLAPVPNYLSRVIQELPNMNDKQYTTLRSSETTTVLHDGTGQLFVMPESRQKNRVEFEVLEYAPLLDSSNMTMENWSEIARDVQKYYSFFDGFVVLHGTDTMAYTASALSMMFDHLGKPVIITGSQVPIFEQRSDARENLSGAVFCAGHYNIPEVMLFFHNKLYRGNRVSKLDASSYDAFHSPNMLPLADIDMYINIRWDIIYRDPSIEEFVIQDEMEPNVTLLRFYPGLTSELLSNFLRPPVRGVVLQTFGAGNGPDSRPGVLQALKQACDDGVVIINCTQCIKGGVSPSYAAGVALQKCGVVLGGDMTPEAALTKLSYVLAKNVAVAEKRELMKMNLRGEITVENVGRREISLDNKRFLGKLAGALHLTSAPELLQLNKALMPSLLCAAAAAGDGAVTLKKLLSGSEATQAVSCADYDRRTPLHVAASCGDEAAVRFILTCGGSVHLKDFNGDTALMSACKSKSVGIVKMLVAAGAHFPYSEQTRVAGDLCLAAFHNQTECLESYGEAGADFSFPDFNGNSPLHVASRHGNERSIEVMLKYSCDCTFQDYNGDTAADVARKSNHTRIVELINRLNIQQNI